MQGQRIDRVIRPRRPVTHLCLSIDVGQVLPLNASHHGEESPDEVAAGTVRQNRFHLAFHPRELGGDRGLIGR